MNELFLAPPALAMALAIILLSLVLPNGFVGGLLLLPRCQGSRFVA
jgi:hypothetical protein